MLEKELCARDRCSVRNESLRIALGRTKLFGLSAPQVRCLSSQRGPSLHRLDCGLRTAITDKGVPGDRVVRSDSLVVHDSTLAHNTTARVRVIFTETCRSTPLREYLALAPRLYQ
jgi:hypothetical protein